MQKLYRIVPKNLDVFRQKCTKNFRCVQAKVVPNCAEYFRCVQAKFVPNCTENFRCVQAKFVPNCTENFRCSGKSCTEFYRKF